MEAAQGGGASERDASKQWHSQEETRERDRQRRVWTVPVKSYSMRQTPHVEQSFNKIEILVMDLV